MERYKVIGISNTNSRTMITVAPSHIIAVLNEANPGIISINPVPDLRIVTLKLQRLFIDVPMNGIFTEPHMQTHATVGIITTEHSA